eukprot:4614403-Pyramimonas_sp.AAC.2
MVRPHPSKHPWYTPMTVRTVAVVAVTTNTIAGSSECSRSFARRRATPARLSNPQRDTHTATVGYARHYYLRGGFKAGWGGFKAGRGGFKPVRGGFKAGR